MEECASFWDWSEEVELLQQAIRTDLDSSNELRIAAPPNSPCNKVRNEDKTAKSEALRHPKSNLEGLYSKNELETEGATLAEGGVAGKPLITEGGAPSEGVVGSSNQIGCAGGSGTPDLVRSVVLDAAGSEQKWESEEVTKSSGSQCKQPLSKRQKDHVMDTDESLHLKANRLNLEGKFLSASESSSEEHSCTLETLGTPSLTQQAPQSSPLPLGLPLHFSNLSSCKSSKRAPRRPRQRRLEQIGHQHLAVRPVMASFRGQTMVDQPVPPSFRRQDTAVQPVLTSFGRQETAFQKPARLKTHFKRSHPLLDLTATDWLQYSPETFSVSEDSLSLSKEECIYTPEKRQNLSKIESSPSESVGQSKTQNPSKTERTGSPLESVGQSSLVESADSPSERKLDSEPDAFSLEYSPSNSSLDGSFRYEERQALLESPLSSRASSSSNLGEGEASSDSTTDTSDSHLYLQCDPLPPSACTVSPASTPPPASNSEESRTFRLPPHVTDPAEAEELEQIWAARLRARRAEHGDQHYFTAAELMSPPWNKLVFWHGCDKKRQPVLYCRLGLAVRTLPRHMQERMGCALYSMVELAENSLWRPECGWGFQRMTVIVDADGLGITRMAPVEALKHGFKLIHRDYPARQGHTYIINVPPLLNIVIGIFKRAIGYNEIEASERLSVCGRNYRSRLQEAFVPEMLHPDLGGSCSCCGQSTDEGEETAARKLLKVPLEQKRMCRPEDWLLDTIAPHQR